MEDAAGSEVCRSPNHSSEVTDDKNWPNDWRSTNNWRGEDRWREYEASLPDDAVDAVPAPITEPIKTTPTPAPETSRVWADLNDTPRQTQENETTIVSPCKSDAARGTHSANATIRVEKVTVQTKTQSMEVARDTVTDRHTLLRLRKLALTGPPISREDRIDRQVMANRLSLTPQLYNLLVFGEGDDTDGKPQTATCALPPPDTSSSP